MSPFFRVLLWPVSMLYGMVVRLRNHLYDIGYKKSFKFQCPVIAVGNLSVGGNGKTPMVEYLVRLISPRFKPAVLSRGYGRKSRGFRMVQQHHNATEVGDEPLQMFKKFYPGLTVAVAESRALGIPSLLLEQPAVEAIILDDAFQHRSVVPHLNILVTDFNLPFYQDFLLPSGRLREPRAGVSRADVVVVTKCPADIDSQLRREITGRIRVFDREIQVFFTSINYLGPKHFITGKRPDNAEEVLLISGIAKPQSLMEFVSAQYKISGHLEFSDHYQYRPADVDRIKRKYLQMESEKCIILTTEKDWVRLMEYKQALVDLPLYYLPIECTFIQDANRFDQIVVNSLGSFQNSNP